MEAAFAIVRVGHEHLPLLEELWRADWLDAHPGDVVGANEAAAGIQKSLDHQDFLTSASFWLLAAQEDGRFVGYVTIARIPKADHRLLYLYVDELFVLTAFRRRGVATALLEAVTDLGIRLSAAGIRLIVDADNGAARRLYQTHGFTEGEQVFCQRHLQ